ncbi:hypothetical protein T4D_9195 [Trichinella pseudospiralis]|uniref:Uncharacterized protein n=1 Tax=Trichinella pseudospiralis TaxID=6337 RepID=A0A0V1G1X5_TRIPS|nr:hypothetical protein T4D_9195 [Trichinella pseudospiralis]
MTHLTVEVINLIFKIFTLYLVENGYTVENVMEFKIHSSLIELPLLKKILACAMIRLTAPDFIMQHNIYIASKKSTSYHFFTSSKNEGLQLPLLKYK